MWFILISKYLSQRFYRKLCLNSPFWTTTLTDTLLYTCYRFQHQIPTIFFLFLIIVFTFLKVYNSTEYRPEWQSCTSTKTEQGYWGQASCHKSLHVWQDPVVSRLHSLNLSEICVPLSSTLRFISGLSSSSPFAICIRIRIRILYSSVFCVLNLVFLADFLV